MGVCNNTERGAPYISAPYSTGRYNLRCIPGDVICDATFSIYLADTISEARRVSLLSLDARLPSIRVAVVRTIDADGRGGEVG